jgi:hypothetical protein
MQRLSVTMILAVLLGGCAMFHQPLPPAPAPLPNSAPVATKPAGPMDADGTPIQTLPFRLGVSSATVEKLAKQQACMGGQGAALVTEQGPVEVYRMQCDNGKVFMARCEMRQCRQM